MDSFSAVFLSLYAFDFLSFRYSSFFTVVFRFYGIPPLQYFFVFTVFLLLYAIPPSFLNSRLLDFTLDLLILFHPVFCVFGFDILV